MQDQDTRPVNAPEDWEAERDELHRALRELYRGALDDSMPGTALVEWHERHPWAAAIVR